ncbi:TRAP transporter permease [Bacillus chungangensis]|uniref:TRAP transporter 4TM/12TM fusion protein n=1 Tax=Bacillus chungangensis TaxID=587633 RepID=A0ABT9WYD8_9BACI|nr:TRAP transporter permease [Bacillus chungangensis]MDQ0178128.1 TRAP transporter 4TM/12TM fusion protein [Bacillus chungangensis]
MILKRDAAFVQWIITGLAICLSFFVLYYAVFGSVIAMKQRAIVLLLSFVLCFLIYPAVKKQQERLSIVDVLLVMLSVAVTVYIVIHFESFILRAGSTTTMDMIMGSAAIFLVLESARRTIGWALPLIALFFMLYATFGHYLPGMFGHNGYSFSRMIHHLYLTTEGIFGTALGVAATFVFLFILFGAFLERSGASKYFMDLAISLTGKSKGGPAKISIFASGLMGSISGSSIANVVGTGTFTIPLMKKIGYKPTYAAAVEASASTGGQIMPPIMGASAFIMAEMLGVPYMDIVVAAILPAILYYLSLYMNVHLEAAKIGLEGIPEAQIPKFRKIFFQGLPFLAPMAMIFIVLFTGASPMKAAYIGIFVLLAASLIKKSSRMNVKTLVSSLKDAAVTSVSIVSATACAGMIIGVVSLTGLGLKFTDFVISFAQGHILIGLILTMVASIVLGMSLPTVATYIVLSVLTAPALEQLGVPIFAAHLFILYFGVFADITPPVALASYAASGIAKCSPMAASFKTLRVALIGFLIPFLFVYFPALLWQGSIIEIIIATVTAILAIIAIAASLNGYFIAKTTWLQRILLLASGGMLIVSEWITDVIGLIVLVFVYGWQRYQKNH